MENEIEKHRFYHNSQLSKHWKRVHNSFGWNFLCLRKTQTSFEGSCVENRFFWTVRFNWSTIDVCRIILFRDRTWNVGRFVGVKILASVDLLWCSESFSWNILYTKSTVPKENNSTKRLFLVHFYTWLLPFRFSEKNEHQSTTFGRSCALWEVTYSTRTLRILVCRLGWHPAQGCRRPTLWQKRTKKESGQSRQLKETVAPVSQSSSILVDFDKNTEMKNQGEDHKCKKSGDAVNYWCCVRREWGLCALCHVSKSQWKPFWLATQRDPQNDWTATQNRVNYDVFAQMSVNTKIEHRTLAWVLVITATRVNLHIELAQRTFRNRS